MSLIKDFTAVKPPSTAYRKNFFLGCFSCSGDTMQSPEEVNSPSTTRRRLWVFKWKSSLKKSTGKKIPVEINTAGVHLKSRSVTFSPATSNKTWEIQVVEEDETLTKKPVIMVDHKNHFPATSDEQNSRRKKWLDVVKRQNRSYGSRRKETKSAAVAPPPPQPVYFDSPEKKPVKVSHDDPIVFSSKKPLNQFISPPLAAPAKVKKPPAGVGGVDEKRSLNKTTSLGGGFDSIIGMSIILMTLVIMMLWGKICAILCTSAWFFIAPRLAVAAAGEHSAVATVEERRAESRDNLDFESVEYKKKVVLEGLLQRNHRNVIAGRL